MPNTKELAAVFESHIQTQKGIQPAITVVYIPIGTHNWHSIVVTTNKERDKVYVHYASSEGLKTNCKSNILCKMYPKAVISAVTNQQCKSKDVTLIQKIDVALMKSNSWLRSAALSEPDSTASTNTLQKYIVDTFNVDPQVLKDTTPISNLPMYPIAYPRKHIDWSITWDSPYLTDAEKQILHRDFDADIAYSNSFRDCRKIFEKAMLTAKFSTKYTAVALHGNPGGGKSKMVLNDFCAMNNIPVIHLTCDQLMTISTFFVTVNPVDREAVLGKGDTDILKRHLTDRLTSLQLDLVKAKKVENPNANEIQQIEHNIHDTLDSLDKITKLSSTTTDLMQVASILFKCLEHNLPVVAFLDEFILTSTQFQNALSPIISDGTYKVGNVVGYNDFTVLWVFAWNPNTTNVKSWDQKFFDRTRFIQVEDLPRDLLVEYKINKTLVGMNKAHGKTIDFTSIDKDFDDAIAAYPENKKDLLIAKDIAHHANGCQKTIEWFTKKRIQEITTTITPTGTPGDFDAVYLDNVTCGTNKETKVAIDEIDKLTNKINSQLYITTRGKDSKNPDRNSYFYISDRSMESFIDTIMCYRDVKKAVHRFIFDLIPGGNTVKLGGGIADKSSYEDKVPQAIADTIVNTLGATITDLNTKLFVNVAPVAITNAQKALDASIVDPKLWPDIPTPTVTATPVQPQPKSMSILDEADNLMG